MDEIPDLSDEDVSPESINRLFDSLDRPVMIASDLVDAFDTTRSNANYHLDRLVEGGHICQEKVGGAAVVYWPASPTSATSQETEAAI